jgi:transcription antitermination factor NusG
MSTDSRWFAAYVRSRHEARTAQLLDQREIEFFLPQYKSERQWSDRKVELLLPLFPGYLFVRMTPHDKTRVLETPGVLYLVGASGRPEALEDAEIEHLKTALRGHYDPRPCACVKAGDRVRVTAGPLQGTHGFMVREKNKNRVVVTLELIQRAMSVEVDMSAIAPAGA